MLFFFKHYNVAIALMQLVCAYIVMVRNLATYGRQIIWERGPHLNVAACVLHPNNTGAHTQALLEVTMVLLDVIQI